MINMLDRRLFVSLFSPDVVHTASHMTMWPYCRGYNPQADDPQTASPSFRGIRCFWSLRLVLLENSCLQWPIEIANWALRKESKLLMLALWACKQRSWKIVPKTPSGLHFELTDQKLSAKLLSPPPSLPHSSCCFHWSFDQSYCPPFFSLPTLCSSPSCEEWDELTHCCAISLPQMYSPIISCI